MATLRAKKQTTMREALDLAKLDPKNTIPIAKEGGVPAVPQPPLKRIRTKSFGFFAFTYTWYIFDRWKIIVYFVG